MYDMKIKERYHMKVQEVLLGNGGKSYLLVGNDGVPIYPVAKYLKYLDLSGKSLNTIKTYCYSLKVFYEFLAVIETDYSEVTFGILTHFVGWLRMPHDNEKVMSLFSPKAIRSEKSCNLIMTVVVNYYDYLYRTELLTSDISMDENNKDAVIASLKRKIKSLEDEIHDLKNQLKISYSDFYEKL